MIKMAMVLLFTGLVSTVMSAGTENDKAPPRNRPVPEEIFSKMDANSDGCVSLQEFKDAHQKRMQHEQQGNTGHHSPQQQAP